MFPFSINSKKKHILYLEGLKLFWDWINFIPDFEIWQEKKKCSGDSFFFVQKQQRGESIFPILKSKLSENNMLLRILNVVYVSV